MPWHSEEDIKSNNKYSTQNKKIKKIYSYFLHNLSISKYREKILHIRKTLKQSIKFIKDKNLYFDFIYIDGSHLYENFKSDYILSKQLIYKHNDYSGRLTGDDYDVSINELNDVRINNDDIEKLLIKHLNKDFISLDNGMKFHPGITYFFSKISDEIIKTKSGFWYKK